MGILAEERIRHVPAVELTDGQQIDHRHQQADPRSPGNRVQLHINAIAGQKLPEHQILRHRVQDRIALLDVASGRRRTDRRGRQPVEEQGNGDDQSRQRTGDADLQDRLAVEHRLTLNNDRAERTGEGNDPQPRNRDRRHGDEIRQTDRRASPAPDDVVPHLVNEQDAHNRRRERNASHNPRRIAEHIDAIVERADHEGRKNGHHKQHHRQHGIGFGRRNDERQRHNLHIVTRFAQEGGESQRRHPRPNLRVDLLGGGVQFADHGQRATAIPGVPFDGHQPIERQAHPPHQFETIKGVCNVWFHKTILICSRNL
jgi:hypothetical protein